jgi:Cu/Ag efflux protein CusF
MDQQTHTCRALGWTAALAALALVAAPAASTAQTTQSTSSTPTSTSTHVSTTVTVESVDVANRHLTVKLPDGQREVFQVSPEMRRLDEIKPGDKIKATYYAEVAFAIADPGKPLPEDSDTVVGARASKDAAPGALIGRSAVVTGEVLAIDLPNSKVKVVNAKGGEVHDLDVTTPEGKQFLTKLKVGDKVTARVKEALLVSVDRE